MLHRLFATIFIALLSALSACTSLPRYEHPLLGGVTPKEVVQAIGCELLASLPKWRKARQNEIVKGQLVAVADLTLQVDQQATLTPTFTHTDIVSAALTRTLGWGLKLDTTAQRTYSESVVFLIDPTKNLDNEVSKCANFDSAGHSISSDLGIEDAIERGVNSGTNLGHFSGSNSSSGNPALDNIYAKGKSSFGQTVQFVVTMNVNGLGPTWTLKYFKGPGNLFLAQRMDTHKVIVSFADYVPSDTKAAKASLTEQYLKLICDATVKAGGAGAKCPGLEEKGGNLNLWSINPYNSGAAAAAAAPKRKDQNLEDSINQARENNARLRLQGLGGVLGTPP